MSLSVDEGRLLAVYRAIKRFNDYSLIPLEDASILAIFLAAVVDIQNKEKELDAEKIEVLLDGYVAGVVASRLIASGVSTYVETEQNPSEEG